MRSNHPEAGRPGIFARACAVASVLAISLAFAAGAGAAHADELPVDAPAQAAQATTATPADSGECSGDDCDGGAWKVARGEFNEASYWGMDPGHNCTNYVAWRLSQDGVERPATSPGNASDWAERARVDGYLVNAVPTVGAIAQWNGNTAGYTSDGHVAYIERVNDDGTILVSEDYWLDGSQTGPLTYRVVDMRTVSNVIHYIDMRSWLRGASASDGSWDVDSMGLNPNAVAMSAMRLEADGKVRVYLKESDTLRVVTEGASGWDVTDTRIPLTGNTIAAVDMKRAWPYVMTTEEGELTMLVGTAPGWQRMATGIPVGSDFDAIDLGALLPTIYVSEGGELFEVWNDLYGWHKEPTGTPVTGAVSATVNALGWPEVYSVEEGVLLRSWADELGWHTESTMVAASGAFSAARVGDTIQVMLVNDGTLLQASRDASGIWSAKPTGITPGAIFTTLDTAGVSPALVQLGTAPQAPVDGTADAEATDAEAPDAPATDPVVTDPVVTEPVVTEPVAP